MVCCYGPQAFRGLSSWLRHRKGKGVETGALDAKIQFDEQELSASAG